ncbi:MAG TPA: M20/M25/M40 family metallo-hydrolase, partial [Candidatus Sulfomarinibacteraceae bacterium]|nr:M20/M25/M40 family metallo-hydrolase [Candidatus Sulfomarinibacteraceae bacterium]
MGDAGTVRPCDELSEARWAAAHDRLVATLRELIRIPSVNPPDPPGPELDAARTIAAMLEASGVPATVYEPFSGRGSVVARLRGDGTGGDPLLLLSHLDVVPAPPDRWTHDPFGADVADGYVYGRGAVDMKDLVAMEVEVVRLLAESASAAGLDPATDPVPGLRRDVLLAVTADEEAGGQEGIGWLVDHHPEHLRAAGALSESGGVSLEVGGRRLYPIQVAEKGYAVYRLTFRGTWGHGSMP